MFGHRLSDALDSKMTCTLRLWPRLDNPTFSRSAFEVSIVFQINPIVVKKICIAFFFWCVTVILSSCRLHTGWPMLSDELDSKPEVICSSFLINAGCVWAFTPLTESFFFCLFSPSAAGAVCAERLHPLGSGSGGLRVQTLLPASAGSGWQLSVQPAGAHRSAAHLDHRRPQTLLRAYSACYTTPPCIIFYCLVILISLVVSHTVAKL